VFRRIIVAYDGSERAQDALALALRLRDPDDGGLILACAISERAWRPGDARQVSVAVSDETALMLAAGRAKVPAGIRVSLRVPVASSPARGLTELAEDEHADLIVVGSSRRSSSGQIWLERTAGRLLQGAPCAVAVAPADVRGTEAFHHIGIAYDGSPDATSALAAGYALAAQTGAAITLFYALTGISVADERDALRDRLHAQEMLDEAAVAAPAGVNPRTLLLYGVPGKAIADACEGIVDLLVTGSRGYGPVQRALMGSVAEALMEGAPHPVLVLPRTAAAAVPDPEHAHMGAEA
jgi:nucleotide-binding universal stress UspA family protein